MSGVVDTLPDKPLSMDAIDTLRESESVAFASGVEQYFGDMAPAGVEAVTENLVLSTADTTRVLSRREGTGWVVEREFGHGPDEDPEEVGLLVHAQASEHLSEAMERGRSE